MNIIWNLITNTTILKSIARHALSGLGVYLVSKGIISDSGWTDVVGAACTLFAFSHSVWDKREDITADIKTKVNDIAGQKVLLALLIPVLAFAIGCANTQVINATKGTGVTLDLPIGYNGANLFQISLKAGQFDNVTAVQPVSTNKIYAPSLSVVSATRGNISAPTLGSSSTNDTAATVSGGDRFSFNSGSAQSSETNKAGSSTSEANQ